MGAFSIYHWLLILLIVALVAVPGVRILRRAGFSGWWVILWFIPLANVVGLWLFAFLRWPIESGRPEGN